MRVTVLDYGTGNLHSLAKALTMAGARVAIEADPMRCLDTDVLVLPGVGAFSHAAGCIAPARQMIRDALSDGLPAIGICLGMQLLFDASDEGPGDGLSLISGRVERLVAARVPQIGWNSVEGSTDTLLGMAPLGSVYYANSFVARPRSLETVVAWSTHGTDRFPAIVRMGRTIGVQFHPEKSSRVGVRFLTAALAEVMR
jgi:glutamine amidotransferase